MTEISSPIRPKLNGKGQPVKPRTLITREFSEFVKYYRETRNVSIIELSALIGRKGNYVHYIENRKTRTTTLETYSILAEVIGFTPGEQLPPTKKVERPAKRTFSTAERRLRHKYLIHIASFCEVCADYHPEGCEKNQGNGALSETGCPFLHVNTPEKRDYAPPETLALAVVAMCAACDSTDLCFDCPLILLRKKKKKWAVYGQGRIVPKGDGECTLTR